MDSEPQHENIKKQKIKKKILETTLKLKNNVSSIIYWTVLHQINKAIKSRTKSILTCHDKKLKILHQRQQHNDESDYCNNYFKYTICNMSSYQLPHDEYTALSSGLDHYIPSKTDDDLPLGPIISNTETASYHLAKYLATTMLQLSKSEYTVYNNLEFITI